MPSEKAKTAGKFIILMLCVAVLFFLLLPFLDHSSNTATQAQGPNKATPQIFTSNPLSELVNKVYAMFSRDQKRKEAALQLAQAQARPAPQAEHAPLPARYDLAGQPADATSSIDVTYDTYGEAGFINEDGEWILVRQTAPDTYQKGMHEINSSDSPYDRLVRQERAAPYTGAPLTAGPDIPDSKWARVWKPIKKFFGFEETPAQPLRPVPQTMLAAAPQTLPDAQTSNGTPRDFAKAGLDQIGWSSLPGANASDGPDVLDYMMDPDARLHDIAERLKQTAYETLSPQHAKEVEKEIEDRRQAARLAVRQQLEERLNQAAEGLEPEEMVTKAISCIEPHAASLSKKSDDCGEYTPISPQDHEAQQQALQDGELAKARRDQQIQQETGLTPRDQKPKIIPFYGKTPAGPPPQAEGLEYADEIARDYQEQFNYVYEQAGCTQHDCYWMGADDFLLSDLTLSRTITGAGAEYQGSGTDSREYWAGFQAKKLTEAQTEEEVQKWTDTLPDGTINADLSARVERLRLHVLPVDRDKARELFTSRPSQTEAAQSRTPAPFVLSNTANAKALHEDFPDAPLSKMIYDDDILLQSTTSRSERSAALDKILTDRVLLVHTIAKEQEQKLNGDVAKSVVSKGMEEKKEELKKAAETFK